MGTPLRLFLAAILLLPSAVMAYNACMYADTGCITDVRYTPWGYTQWRALCASDDGIQEITGTLNGNQIYELCGSDALYYQVAWA
jgi:hypothetical protein